MNYFAHGIRFLDRPYFLAGTAVPDWLSVADRKVRMRSKRAHPVAESSSTLNSEVAKGVVQHLHDDDWFHGTVAFHETTSVLGRLFQETLGDGYYTGFLGHIVMEILLDGVLIRNNPGAIDDYYRSMAEVNADLVQETVNDIARVPTERLSMFIGLFLRERFLYDYLEPKRLLVRLNQVMRRVKLSPLPAATLDVLVEGEKLVATRLHELLPQSHFCLESTR